MHQAGSLTFVLGACTSTIAEDATRAAMYRGGTDQTVSARVIAGAVTRGGVPALVRALKD